MHKMKIRLHAFEPFSRANGPGLRAVVWFQGCTLRCPDCFNPVTQDPRGGYASDTASLVTEILALDAQIEGISISGGEPFQQPEALLDLLRQLSVPRLSRLVFSGYTLPEIDCLPIGPNILQFIDVLIAGKYLASQHVGHGLLGSANQQIHFLTNRYSLTELGQVPRQEFVLHADGSITSSGIVRCDELGHDSLRGRHVKGNTGLRTPPRPKGCRVEFEC
jgi:anaerobic ribonucleoside-triphosphate reductase activating protein